jgi:hypothetical protein
LSVEQTPTEPTRHQNMYAHQMWQQQRFFAAFLVVVGFVMTAILVFQNQLFRNSNYIWALYVPSGLILGGAFLAYRWRSHVKVLDSGVRISTLMSSVMIGYDSIRLVKVQPLQNHFLEQRARMVVRAMKPHMQKPALFIRLRADAEELAALQKRLGSRLMHEDTIAIPVPDADKLAWEISPHLPERIGQNLGGKRRKRRR